MKSIYAILLGLTMCFAIGCTSDHCCDNHCDSKCECKENGTCCCEDGVCKPECDCKNCDCK